MMGRRRARIPMADLYTIFSAAGSIASSAEIRLAWQQHLLDQGHDPDAAFRELAGAIARTYAVVARYAGLRLLNGP